MKRPAVKSAIIISLFLAGLAVMTTESNAIDNRGHYYVYGLGQKTCADYIKFREKRLEALENHEKYTKEELYEIVDKVIEHWLAGFFTAHDYYVADTYDVVGKTTMEELKARLETLCRANPKQHFAEAVITLAQQLNPARVKADPGK
jgi:hypothetical protein